MVAVVSYIACLLQIMVPGKTNVSLTLSWSTDYDPAAAAEQTSAGKLGPRGDAEAQVSCSCAITL